MGRQNATFKLGSAFDNSGDRHHGHVDATALGEDLGPRVMTVTVKGALGMIPGVGGLLAEVAGQFIPQQRVERLEA